MKWKPQSIMLIISLKSHKLNTAFLSQELTSSQSKYCVGRNVPDTNAVCWRGAAISIQSEVFNISKSEKDTLIPCEGDVWWPFHVPEIVLGSKNADGRWPFSILSSWQSGTGKHLDGALLDPWMSVHRELVLVIHAPIVTCHKREA